MTASPLLLAEGAVDTAITTLGYAAPGMPDTGLVPVVPASLLPHGEATLASTGVRVVVESFLAADQDPHNHLNLTLTHEQQIQTGERITSVLWQCTSTPVLNISPGIGFFAPLTDASSD